MRFHTTARLEEVGEKVVPAVEKKGRHQAGRRTSMGSRSMEYTTTHKYRTHRIQKKNGSRMKIEGEDYV